MAVAVGDLNGDGALDLAVGTGSGVAVLLGQGDGSFQEARTFGVGNAANSVVVGDLNGDGALDLAVGTRSGVAVLLGQGDGIFQAPLSSGCCGGTLLVGVSDFNGDGKPDLAAAPTRCCWARATGPSSRHSPSGPRVSTLARRRWATSTAMGSPTWQ